MRITWSGVFTTVIVTLATAVAVYADMMLASRLDGMPRPAAQARDQKGSPSPNSLSPLIGVRIVDLDLWAVASLPTTSAEVIRCEGADPFELLPGDNQQTVGS